MIRPSDERHRADAVAQMFQYLGRGAIGVIEAEHADDLISGFMNAEVDGGA